MDKSHVVRAWGRILAGHRPALSLEITRECPLHCPGCYAYEEGHLGDAGPLRLLQDFRGDDLVHRVNALVDRVKPLHVSIVGGEPLVRYRELDVLIPQLVARGLHVRVVTSAVRQIPLAWAKIGNLDITVSIDGLQPEHDIRRTPATYDRILKHIEGHSITVHCTVTSEMMHRASYLEEFLQFWSAQASVKRVWFSLFTPQMHAQNVETLSRDQRRQFIAEMQRMRPIYSKLDMAEGMIEEFATPPRSPKDCIFAQTTLSVSADMKSTITPCQFGGAPDCSNCGCIASMGLAAVGNFRLGGLVPVGAIFRASVRIGAALNRPANGRAGAAQA